MKIATRHILNIVLFIVVTGALTTSGSLYLYSRSQIILQDDLQERMIEHAKLSALLFSGEEINKIQTEEDTSTPLFKNLVNRAKHIKESLNNIEYVYIMRRTSDPSKLSFVVEDDMLNTTKEIDENNDGIISDSEAVSQFGDLFDVSEIPQMQYGAFIKPTVDEKVTIDQWGAWISSYAPIRDAKNNTVAIIGIDMNASTFYEETYRAFSPTALLIILVGTLAIFLFALSMLWKQRNKTTKEVDEYKKTIIAIATHKLSNLILTIHWRIGELKSKNETENNEAINRLQTVDKELQKVIQDLRNLTHSDNPHTAKNFFSSHNNKKSTG